MLFPELRTHPAQLKMRVIKKKGKKRGLKGLEAHVTGAMNITVERELMAQQKKWAAAPSYTPKLWG